MELPVTESCTDNLSIKNAIVFTIAIAFDSAQAMSGNRGIPLIIAGILLGIFFLVYSMEQNGGGTPPVSDKLLMGIILCISVHCQRYSVSTSPIHLHADMRQGNPKIYHCSWKAGFFS
jgi:hypothetical protein